MVIRSLVTQANSVDCGAVAIVETARNRIAAKVLVVMIAGWFGI